MPQKHVIYYFSGTGNSLRTALSMQRALGSCDVISLGKTALPVGEVESIGFVFPCYFGGVPHRVLEGIKEMDFSAQKSTYFYAVVTYGAMAASTVQQFARALKDSGATLNYAATIRAFANYVVMYDMSNKVAEKIAATKAELQIVIPDVIAQKTLEIKKPSPVLLAYHRMASRQVATRDENFVVRESCNACGLCEQVCPVGNIKLVEKRPEWLHRCEQCLACLHWCPKRAIDYGEKTRGRGRYTNPEVTTKMFIDCLNGAGIQ